MTKVMYDSTDRGLFPVNPFAVGGYGGAHNNYQSYWWFVLDYPRAHHVFIVASASDDGPKGAQDVALDVEKGDATPAQVVAWLRRQWARGVKRPIVYAPLSLMEEIYRELRAAGIPYCVDGAPIRIWTAHPSGRMHICTPGCGFSTPARGPDGTQCVWNPNGMNIDVSLLRDDFFTSPAPTPPLPPLPKETVMITTYTTNDHRVGIVAETSNGQVFHIEQQGPSGVSGQNADWWRTSDGKPHWLSLGVPGE